MSSAYMWIQEFYYIKGIWVRPGYIHVPHWTSTRCTSCGDGIHRWKHSRCQFWHANPIAVVTSTQEPQASGNNDKLMMLIDCGYSYCSSHWIGNSVSGICPCYRHCWSRLACLQLVAVICESFLWHDARTWLMAKCTIQMYIHFV